MAGNCAVSHLDHDPTDSPAPGNGLRSPLRCLAVAAEAETVALWASSATLPPRLLAMLPPEGDAALLAPLGTSARFSRYRRADLFLCQVHLPGRESGTVDLVLGWRQRGWKVAELEPWLRATAASLALAATARLEREQLVRGAILGERERLAHELHDGPAQALLCVSMEAHLLSRAVQSGDLERARAAADRIRAELSSLYREFRAAIADLNARTTLAVGLVCAAQQLVERLHRSGIRTELVIEDPGWALPPLAEVQALRVLQEALANVQRHAHARHCLVRLGRRERRPFFEVIDDGGGFEPGKRRSPLQGRFGLQVMNERMRSVGGTLRVTSAPGRGTCITASFPEVSEPGSPGWDHATTDR